MSVEGDQIGCEEGMVLCGLRGLQPPLLAWNVPWNVPLSPEY